MRIVNGMRGLLLLAAGIGPVLAEKPAAEVPPNLPPGLYAVIQTSMGNITAELYDKLTPNTVRNFVGLANGTQPWVDPKTKKPVRRPLYDKITFHRVIPDFMIQTGDPTGTGSHNCGYQIKDEIVANLRFDRPGRLAMANVGKPNTGACQFFITEKPYPSLDGGYTIFGQVVDGMNVVSKISHVIRDDSDRPLWPIKLIHVAVMRIVPAPVVLPSAGGTGLFINDAGDVLTAAAAVQDCAEVRLADGGKLQEAWSDSKNGLALLHTQKKPGAVAVFRGGDGVGAEQPVWVASPSGSAETTPATVTATADGHGDNRFLQIAAQPGKPGNPVLDGSGNVAGIVSEPVEGSTPPASLAIKASVITGFLDTTGVKYTAKESATPADSKAIPENAGQFVVQIQCLR